MRIAETPMARANSACEMSSSVRISARNSPGWIARRFPMVIVPSMVIGDFDFECVAVCEAEAYAPLIVHSDTVLSSAVALQWLEAIRWWQTQVLDPSRSVQLSQPHHRASQDIPRQPARSAGREESLGFVVCKRPDHLNRS